MSQIRSGLPLDRTRLSHAEVPYKIFPLSIPMDTQRLESGTELPQQWVAVNIETLLTYPNTSAGRINSRFKSKDHTKDFLNISNTTRLLAVLNGKDNYLEAFWAMERGMLFKSLEQMGFVAVTGPTFSISHEVPDSHNLCMLLRHHRVLFEISKTSLLAIPNIYWRNEWDRRIWTQWLSINTGIRFISRDFSRTKNITPFRKKFAEFLGIISPLKRPFHIIILGVGARKVEEVLVRLDDIGCTCSFATSEPIIKGINKRFLRVGKSCKVPEIDNITKHAFKRRNLDDFDGYLQEIASNLASYRDWKSK